MTKELFLSQLAEELGSLNQVQRQEILGYFEEYLTELEASPEGLSSLESPKDVAAELIAGLREQDILFQVPQVVASMPETKVLQKILSLSVIDLDMVLVGAPVKDISLRIPEQFTPLIEVEEIDQGLSIRQTIPVRIKHHFRYVFGNNRMGTPAVRILVPEEVSIGEMFLESTSGDIDLEQIRVQKLILSSYNGDVSLQNSHVEQINGSLKNGDIELEECHGSMIHLDLFNGDASFSASRFQELQVQLHNGDVELEDVSAEKVGIESLNGDLEIQELLCERICANSKNGDLLLSRLRFTKEALLETKSGNIDLTLSEQEQEVRMQIEASFGEYEVDMGDHRVSGEDGSYQWGSPAAPLYLEAKSKFGDVTISC